MIYPKTALVLLPVVWPNLPNLGLADLKGYLSARNVEVECKDYNNFFYKIADDALKNEWKISCNRYLEENIYDIICVNNTYEYGSMINDLLAFDIVGFSVHKSNIMTTLKVIRDLKNRDKGIRVVLGGPEITSQYLESGTQIIDIFKDISDLLVVGEGETAFYNYVSGRESRKLVAYEEISDPEDLPSPDFSGFDLEAYPRKHTIPLISSRGCIRSCKFCSERLLHNKYRTYSAGQIVEQISYFRTMGINNYIFHDSLINGDLKRLEEMLDAFIVEFGKVNWEAQMVIRDDMSDDIFRKMKKSGCYHLFVGLENGSDKTLSNMNKGYTSKTALDILKKLHEHGLSFGVSIIIGYPGETMDDFQDNMEFISGNKNYIKKIEQVNPFVPYRGTGLTDGRITDSKKEYSEKMEMFMDMLKKEKIKYTSAYISNLVDSKVDRPTGPRGFTYHGN